MQMDMRYPSPARPPAGFPGPVSLELDGGLAELRTDCARMAPHWTADAQAPSGHVPASRIRGLARIMVPETSADLLRGMSEYGD